MKKILLPACFAAIFFTKAAAQSVPVFVDTKPEDALAYPVVINPGSYVPNQLLVMLQPDIVIGELEDAFAAKGFVITETYCSSAPMRVWTLTFSAGTNIEAALKTAKTFSQIEMAQFNHYIAPRVTVPNDAHFPDMWDMDNTGQGGGTPDADIDAPEAWDITTGGLTAEGDTIVVAVIDGGFYLAHEDLNFWKNYGEIPNNGIDDDNNGYIDDFDGWNAYNHNGTIASDNHGTHVAGTVGARGNDSLGVAGVNWGVKVMAVQGSSGTEATAVEAYTYVWMQRRIYNQTNGAQGAFVVSTNASFGVDQGQPANFPIWCAVYDSLGTDGILNAGATANQNWDIDAVGDIPTACASNFMIAVTNTNRYDQRNGSAAYGVTTIDIGAPGTSIWSTLPGNQYGTLTGTSMATPHVAGAIGLMYAAACSGMITDCRNAPDSIALLMRAYLLDSSDPNATLAGITTSGGRLNLYNALLAVQTYDCLHTPVEENGNSSGEIIGLYPNPAGENTQLVFNSTANARATILVTDMLGQQVMTISQTANAGTNSVFLDVSRLSAGVYFVNIQIDGQTSKAMRLVVE